MARSLVSLAGHLVERILQFLHSRRAFKLGSDDPFRIDDKKPGLGGEPPLGYGIDCDTLCRVLVDLDVDEVYPPLVLRLQLSCELQLRTAEPAGAVAGRSKQDEQRTAGRQPISDRLGVHVGTWVD